jgi:WD40 repeat protein
VPGLTQPLLKQRSQGTLNDYVTAIAWSPNCSLAIASAAGEILLVNPETQAEIILQEAKGESIDCLAFSADGQYLAAGGQSGQLLIWPIAFTNCAIYPPPTTPLPPSHLARSPHLESHPQRTRL